MYELMATFKSLNKTLFLRKRCFCKNNKTATLCKNNRYIIIYYTLLWHRGFSTQVNRVNAFYFYSSNQIDFYNQQT